MNYLGAFTLTGSAPRRGGPGPEVMVHFPFNPSGWSEELLTAQLAGAADAIARLIDYRGGDSRSTRWHVIPLVELTV